MPEPAVGLCAICQHCRIVPGGRSTFYLCQRSLTDPAFPKYPPLPVVACRGYEPEDAERDDKLAR
jgi:hypothetical protein